MDGLQWNFLLFHGWFRGTPILGLHVEAKIHGFQANMVPEMLRHWYHGHHGYHPRPPRHTSSDLMRSCFPSLALMRWYLEPCPWWIWWMSTWGTWDLQTHYMYMYMILYDVYMYTGWWFQSLWKIFYSQLGWLFPIYGKIKFMFQTTNQKRLVFPMKTIYK